jgi:hypothetical protein
MTLIIRTYGGLGNQMFQYALGRALACKYNTPLLLDISWFKQQTLRKFDLDSLQLKANIAKPQDIACYRPKNKFIRTIIILWSQLLPLRSKRYYKEKSIGVFDADVLRTSPNVYLDGFWQHFKYFEKNAQILRAEFKPKKLSRRAHQYLRQLQIGNSVAIHIRRGDYIQDPQVQAFHGTCSCEYYAKAITYILKKVPQVRFYIFTDDPAGIPKELDTRGRPVSVVTKVSDVESLYIMSRTKHVIIANSSFSWWGAWLNENPQKIIIAPRYWFAHKKYKHISIVPLTWIKI